VNKIRFLVSTSVGLLALTALAAGLTWFLGIREAQPAQQVSPLETPTLAPTVLPISTPIPTPTPYFTETPPPVPTPLPTPIVTPIPVAEPPFIPGLEGAVPESFHIILREDNEVWMVNSDGSDRRLLIDTEDEASLYLGHYPVQGIEGPSLRWGSVSPDGTKLALVVTNLWEPEYKGQSFKWDIYILDIQTGEFRFLVEGREPVWSPDGTRIAYVWGGGLWVVDVKSGERKDLFLAKEDYWVRDISWSPDGQRIAFVHEIAPHGQRPEMLVINTDESREPVSLKIPDLWAPEGLVWTLDGTSLLFTSAERDPETAQWSQSIFKLNLNSKDLTRLTVDTTVSSFVPRPQDGDWIVFAGARHYEQTEFLYDLWLVSADGFTLRRLTSDLISGWGLRWSPDGTQIAFNRENGEVWVLNLVDGSLRQVYADSADFGVIR
jgi:Tol biopolymer transport system component